MKKYLPLYLYGTTIILGGVFLLVSQIIPFSFLSIRITLGLGLILGAALAILTALSRRRKQVQFAYHEMHALAMLVYGISVLMFCKTWESLIYFTGFLFFFYTFSEIIFCGWLFNLGQSMTYPIIFIRLFLGLLIGVGTIIIMHQADITEVVSLEGYGILLIVVGINILLYVPVLKRGGFNQFEGNFKEVS